MPNWNYTHYVAMGDERELEELAGLLNSLFFREPVMENRFGSHWLVNFHDLFHKGFLADENHRYFNLRGAITVDLPIDEQDPRRYRQLTDEEKRNYFKVEDGKLRFSAYSAYFRSDVIECDIKERYPSVELYFQSETEMFADGCIYDPEGKAGFPYFYFCDGSEGVSEATVGAFISPKPYFKDDLGKIAEDLRSWGPELKLPETLTFEYLSSDRFSQAFHKERDRLLAEGQNAEYSSFTAFAIL